MSQITKTSIVHHRSQQENEPEYAGSLTKFLAALAGAGYGIYGAIRLTDADLQFPYVSNALAKHLPFGFYQYFAAPLLIASTIANYYTHLGIVIDIIIDHFKSLLNCKTPDDFKNWFQKINLSNVSDILGALFGLALAATFIYYNATNPNAPFSLPYNADKGSPNILMQIGALLFMTGAWSNAFTYGLEGIRVTIHAVLDSISWLSPKLKEHINLPIIKELPVFKHDNPLTKLNTCANILMVPATLTGLGYGINAAVRLKPENLGSSPYLSNKLAAHIPLGMHRGIVELSFAGTMINYYSHAGIGVDIIIGAAKTFPWTGTAKEIKDWLQKCTLKNTAHVTGTLCGTALSCAFIYFHATSDDPFSLPYGADKGVPDVLKYMGITLYMSGACSNFFSYFTDLATHTISKPTQGVTTLCSKVKDWVKFSFFNNPVALPAPVAAPLAPPPSSP